MRCLVKGVLAGLLMLPLAALATTAVFSAKITRTLASDENVFGGCMVLLDKSPVSEGLDCTGSWVTFSCSGEHVSKSSALRMFDSAQMAFLMDRTVRVTVDDTRKHNTRCLVTRIDVLSAS